MRVPSRTLGMVRRGRTFGLSYRQALPRNFTASGASSVYEAAPRNLPYQNPSRDWRNYCAPRGSTLDLTRHAAKRRRPGGHEEYRTSNDPSLFSTPAVSAVRVKSRGQLVPVSGRSLTGAARFRQTRKGAHLAKGEHVPRSLDSGISPSQW
jgi:hypothetical protein